MPSIINYCPHPISDTLASFLKERFFFFFMFRLSNFSISFRVGGHAMGSLGSPMNESKFIYLLPVKDIFIAYQVLG